MKDENEELQKQIDAMKLEKRDEVKDRQKFYEGAFWLGRQALTASEAAVRQCDDLRVEYAQKLQEAGNDYFLKSRAAEWLVEKVVRIN